MYAYDNLITKTEGILKNPIRRSREKKCSKTKTNLEIKNDEKLEKMEDELVQFVFLFDEKYCEKKLLSLFGINKSFFNYFTNNEFIVLTTPIKALCTLLTDYYYDFQDEGYGENNLTKFLQDNSKTFSSEVYCKIKNLQIQKTFNGWLNELETTIQEFLEKDTNIKIQNHKFERLDFYYILEKFYLDIQKKLEKIYECSHINHYN